MKIAVPKRTTRALRAFALGIAACACVSAAHAKIDVVTLPQKDTTQLTAETPESRCHPYEYAKSRKDGGPGAYLLFLEGATHGSYQGKGLTDFLNEKTETPIKTITDATASATLAFLDAWIKGDAEAKKALESDMTKRIGPAKIRWEWK